MLKQILIFTLMLVLSFSFCELKAADFKQVVELKGSWQFTVGDDPVWSQPAADISDWDKLPVPGAWEEYYEGYNGYVWYRKNFDFNPEFNKEDLFLFLGYIDDVDEVFVNGQKIGQSGKFPPEFETAYNVERRYPVPKDLLKTSGNVVAVRVYDESKPGGILRGRRIGIYYDADQTLLDVDLSGTWKFTLQKEVNFQKQYFEDKEWSDIYVPANWESQGYENYDGYAYYRKHFNPPYEFTRQDVYLVLGKIDELDKVYINGQLVGRVEHLEEYSRLKISDAYKWFRIYKIPKGVLRTDNVIAVEVLDKFGSGGIYEGPVGIMTEENMFRFKRKPRIEEKEEQNESIFESIFKIIFE